MSYICLSWIGQIGCVGAVETTTGWLLNAPRREWLQGPRVTWDSLDQESAGFAVLPAYPPRRRLQLDLQAVNARTPRRGGLLSGLAAALDKYEHAPHQAFTVRRVQAARGCSIDLLMMRDIDPGV
jgi:hypothetical protein